MMKNKNLLIGLCSVPLLLSISTNMTAQDLRERTYYYEILEPRHEPKPEIKGFATERIKENLDRGLTATPSADGKGIYLSWRLLEQDGTDTSFHLYRSANGKTQRLSKNPIKNTCDFVDQTPVSGKATYWICALDKKKKVIDTSSKLDVDCSLLRNYQSIKLNRNIKAGKIAVADLNGDGIYDYIIRTPEKNVDPGMPGTLDGSTYQIEAYLSDGTFLWSKDLGQGIEPGVWYSPFIAYDFNGDGKAEIALKTAPETTKRNEKGRVDSGEEYLSVWDGMTGKEIARVDWPERNDRYGNLVRQNRNQIGMAYLDGKTPYILACRGTYKLMTVDAWQLKDNKLERAWRWDGDEENPVVRSMGSHNMVCGDVDEDGKDEILLGSCMLDDNGTLLWSTGLGHPDKIYLTDIDPDRPGMEVFLCLSSGFASGGHESPNSHGGRHQVQSTGFGSGYGRSRSAGNTAPAGAGTSTLAGAPSAAPQKKAAAASYAAGDIVEHRVFGRGKVLKATPIAGDCIVEIQFDRVGVKKTMANYAPLKKVEE